MAATYHTHRDELTRHTAALDAAVHQARRRLDAARSALLEVAGGPDGVITQHHIDARRAAAQQADITTLNQARAHVRALDTQLARAESATARAFAEAAADRGELTVDVSAVRVEVEFLAAAGGRAPAGMYRVPEQALSGLDEPSKDAVIAIANSAHAVHVLDVHPGADKPAALSALAAAAHAHQRRILALPATETAADYAHTHRYADTTAAAPTGGEHLQAGRWQLPTGSLVIVDDADHLPAAQLAWLTEHAVATNTKLLLITNPAPERSPAHTLTAVAATHLPWAQHLGTPDPAHRATLTALEHAATHLVTVTDPAIHTHIADLLARRDQLTAAYHTLARDPSAERDHTLTRDRDHGLEL